MLPKALSALGCASAVRCPFDLPSCFELMDAGASPAPDASADALPSSCSDLEVLERVTLALDAASSAIACAFVRAMESKYTFRGWD